MWLFQLCTWSGLPRHTGPSSFVFPVFSKGEAGVHPWNLRLVGGWHWNFLSGNRTDHTHSYSPGVTVS